MGKKEFEARFHELRTEKGNVVVKGHAFRDHPERGFSPVEIVDLVMGSGRLIDNKAATAKPNSYVWQCKGRQGRNAKLAVMIEGKILVISAYR